ncbi:MAG: phage tail protein [Chloroflexi bacterium]|nr:phage tail protein [Chloroflexota bacterium]
MPIQRLAVNSYESPLSFRFVVELDNRRVAAFTECTLPAISWKMQEIIEGGLNTHTHELIGPRQKTKLVLKRGLAASSELMDWYVQTLNQQIQRKRVTVVLLDVTRQPVMTWSIEQALPVKWTGPKLDAKAKTVAVETLEISCGRITVELDAAYKQTVGGGA